MLLAEDGIDNRRLVGAFLDSLGMTHEAVDNGQRAVDLAGGGRFDLVLMDIRMPVLDGLAATTLLRGRGFDKPVIALTANLMQEDLARYAAAGFDRSIGKPIDFALLGATIAELLGQAPAADAVAGEAVVAIDGLAEIRAAFSDSLAPRLARLAALVQAGDWVEASSVAHQL